jgi:hypothetical protein
VFIELVDQLRCVRAHEDSWLVAASQRMSGRHIVDGQLGCPVCEARYPVRAAVADFRTVGVAPAAAPFAAPFASVVGDPVPDAEEAMRLAALLALDEVRAPVVLVGAWGGLASLLLAMAPAVYLVVNPAAPVEERPEISALLAAGALPLAAGVAHGVALDAAGAADDGLVAGAVHALRGGGRLVAPAWAPLPTGVRELARDERHWVAERDAAASAPVALRRAPPG